MYSNVEFSTNMSLILPIGGIKSRSLPLRVFFKFQILTETDPEVFLINLTNYMIYISRNSVEPFVVKLITLLKLCRRQIFC